MPEAAMTRTTPYEETRPDIQNPIYEQPVPNLESRLTQHWSREGAQAVSADSSDATLSDLQKMVHAPDGVLPSD